MAGTEQANWAAQVIAYGDTWWPVMRQLLSYFATAEPPAVPSIGACEPAMSANNNVDRLLRDLEDVLDRWDDEPTQPARIAPPPLAPPRPPQPPRRSREPRRIDFYDD